MASSLLAASHLFKRYGERTVVNDVSFELAAGEVLGLLGPNGAGKTTIVGMLYGLIRPFSGTVLLNGFDPMLDGRRARAKAGIVTQENNLDRDFSVEESLDVFASHYRMSRAERSQRCVEVMELVQLMQYRGASADTLSGGYQRRLVLARALLNRPSVLFLDEPTTGLDPEARQQFWGIIEELRGAGVGILLTTHYMEEASRLCDRILLLREGEVVETGAPRDLVRRVAGETVLEVGGVGPEVIAGICAGTGSWTRPIASRHLLGGGRVEECLPLLEHHRPSFLLRRPADLQDVFLLAAGSELRE